MARMEVLPKSRHAVYLERSKEYAAQMERAASAAAWNTVGLLGVHCVIAAGDALTVGLSGRRWSGQNHDGVLGIVRELGLANAGPPLKQMAAVLELKNQVEYESRPFSEKEALNLMRAAQRVLVWVSNQLGSS